MVTNLKGAGKTLYDKLYCARGEIQGTTVGSVRGPTPVATVGGPISSGFFGLHAAGSHPASGLEGRYAYVGTLRLKLLKVGAVILRNTRRIRFLLSSACPYQRLFFHVAARLAPG